MLLQYSLFSPALITTPTKPHLIELSHVELADGDVALDGDVSRVQGEGGHEVVHGRLPLGQEDTGETSAGGNGNVIETSGEYGRVCGSGVYGRGCGSGVYGRGCGLLI